MKIGFKLFFTFLILIWILGIFAGSFSKLSDEILHLFPFIKKSYSVVCHQNPAKTIGFYGSNLLVCSRCFGIYSGAFLSSVIFLFIRNINISNKYLLFSIFPMLFDIVAYNLNFYSYSKITAFSTGFLLGSVGFFYISDALIDLLKLPKKESFE